MNQKLRDIYLNHHNTYSLQENIRFELAHGTYGTYHQQMECNQPMIEIENAKKRAKTLFNEVFKEVETVQMIMIASQYSSKNRIEKCLFNNQFRVMDSFVTHSWKDYFEGSVTAVVIETPKANLRIEKTIDGICYQDFKVPGKLKIKNPIIFYNASEHIILNLYDDRGCDIWSDDLDKQKQFYETYNAWILDYDREQISAFYKSII